MDDEKSDEWTTRRATSGRRERDESNETERDQETETSDENTRLGGTLALSFFYWVFTLVLIYKTSKYSEKEERSEWSSAIGVSRAKRGKRR